MNSLLGHDGANGISPLLCAFEHGRAELQDEQMRRQDAVPYIAIFVPRSGGEECGSGVAGHWIDGIVRKRRNRSVLMRVSRFNSSLARSLLRGFCDALRHGAVLLSGLLSQSKSGPLLQNARLGTWESRPLA